VKSPADQLPRLLRPRGVRYVLGTLMVAAGLAAIVLVYVGQSWLSSGHTSAARVASGAFYSVAFLISTGCLVHFSRRLAVKWPRAARNEPFRRSARQFSLAGLLMFGGLAAVMASNPTRWPIWLGVVGCCDRSRRAHALAGQAGHAPGIGRHAARQACSASSSEHCPATDHRLAARIRQERI
jgi:hypothetical protein